MAASRSFLVSLSLSPLVEKKSNLNLSPPASCALRTRSLSLRAIHVPRIRNKQTKQKKRDDACASLVRNAFRNKRKKFEPIGKKENETLHLRHADDDFFLSFAILFSSLPLTNETKPTPLSPLNPPPRQRSLSSTWPSDWRRDLFCRFLFEEKEKEVESKFFFSRFSPASLLPPSLSSTSLLLNPSHLAGSRSGPDAPAARCSSSPPPSRRSRPPQGL